MKPHKWAKEIKAWADGAEIECFSEAKSLWMPCRFPEWEEELYYRLAPTQPKEPQYLYVYGVGNECQIHLGSPMGSPAHYVYIGKIKLEVNDE